MVDRHQKLRKEIDEMCGWAGEDVSRDRALTVRRAATHLCIFLMQEQATRNDAKAEQLHAKLIALLFPEYRSHNEQLFRLRKGVFQRSSTMTLKDLDFFDSVCKHSQAVWVALSWKAFRPSPEDGYKQLTHVIHHMPSVFLKYAIHFHGDDSWRGEMVHLLSRLRDEFNQRGGSVIRPFHRWAGTRIPIELVNGANFEDSYIRIERNAFQRPKAVENNVYTSIPGKLKDKPTILERKRCVRFVTTCFASMNPPPDDYPDALKLVLAVHHPDYHHHHPPHHHHPHHHHHLTATQIYWEAAFGAFLGGGI